MSAPTRDEIVRFGPQRGLIGIITRPAPALQSTSAHAAPAQDALPAVIILNAGLLHRVGPNRLYVRLARALAGRGFTVMRFDFSGIGDSAPRADLLPYAEAGPKEAASAMDYLAERGVSNRFVLAGHCSGALFSLLTSKQDARVIGAALINPEGENQAWTEYDFVKKEAQFYANYYGREAVRDPERWKKLLTGKAHYGKIASNLVNGVFLTRLRALRFRQQQDQAARASVDPAQESELVRDYFDPLLDRQGALLLLFSQGSSGLTAWRTRLGGALDRLQRERNLTLRLLPDSDHLLTPPESQERACAELVAWATTNFIATRAQQAPVHPQPNGHE